MSGPACGRQRLAWMGGRGTRFTYFSSSLSFWGSKVSSQPTSTSTLMPPSSSRMDWTAVDSDRAPCRDVKVNMLTDYEGHAHAMAMGDGREAA